MSRSNIQIVSSYNENFISNCDLCFELLRPSTDIEGWGNTTVANKQNIKRKHQPNIKKKVNNHSSSPLKEMD